VGADVFRLGFFADDFHFIDVARRVPLLRTLGGAFGVYPWYRPLSRELYFAVVSAAGPAAAVVAHVLSLSCLGGSAWLVHRLARPLGGARAAMIAPALFVTYGFTKFLIAWPSGFQDLLAVLLTLLALESHARGRYGRAGAWAALAPLAKETGFVAFPLMALHGVLLGPRRRGRWMPWYAATFAAAAGIHLAARSSWHVGLGAARLERSLPDLLAAVSQVLGGFVGRTPALSAGAVALAVVAAAAAAGLMRAPARPGPGANPQDDARAGAPGRGSGAFLLGAATIGLAPLVLGNLSRLTAPHAYYGFIAAPWLAILAARAATLLPRRTCALLLPALAGWNTLALGYRPADLASAAAWRFERWDWPEAVRLSAVARRLGDDLRETLRARPESLVVLYHGLREGSFFQTEDGPATRVSLGDPTVRAYWINEPPFGLVPGRFTVLVFDEQTRHLAPESFSSETQGALAASALAAGRGPSAWAFASHGDSARRARFELRYFRAAAALLARGVGAYRRGLEAEGLADTLGPGPERTATDAMGEASPLAPAVAAMLRRPMDAGAHVALGRAFLARGAALSGAVELRIGIALDPGRREERELLVRVLDQTGADDATREGVERGASAPARDAAPPVQPR
jgi:hypothetical protein